MLSLPSGNFSTPRGMSRFVGMWMSGAAFRVLQSTTFPNFSSAHTIRHIVRLASFLCTIPWSYRTWYTSMHYRLNFSSRQYFRFGLAKPPMLVVAIFGEDLPNVAPFYIFTAVSKGPWLQYVLPTFEGQLFRISKDM
jgi:hypothetical protein